MIDVDIAGCCSAENKGGIVRSVLSSPPRKIDRRVVYTPAPSSRVALNKGVKSKKKNKKQKFSTTGAAGGLGGRVISSTY
jgi:hypothetical protein